MLGLIPPDSGIPIDWPTDTSGGIDWTGIIQHGIDVGQEIIYHTQEGGTVYYDPGMSFPAQPSGTYSPAPQSGGWGAFISDNPLLVGVLLIGGFMLLSRHGRS